MKTASGKLDGPGLQQKSWGCFDSLESTAQLCVSAQERAVPLFPQADLKFPEGEFPSESSQ